jgi:hypothetical protein
MGKRMVDTDRWKKAWFRELGSEGRDIWHWLTDSASLSGIWEVDLARFSFEVGFEVTMDRIREVFGDRVIDIGDDKIWIPAIANFQNPRLSEKCRPHLTVIADLRKRGLWERYLAMFPDGFSSQPAPPEGLPNPSHTLTEGLPNPSSNSLSNSPSSEGGSGGKPTGDPPPPVSLSWRTKAALVREALRKFGTGTRAEGEIKEFLGPELYRVAVKAGTHNIRQVPNNEWYLKTVAEMLQTASEILLQRQAGVSA